MLTKLENKYTLFGSDVFEWTFDSGFRAVLIRDADTQRKMAMLTIRGGSRSDLFLHEGKTGQTPPGTAHFLEHILFDQEDGKTHAKFAACNALSNAYTSYVSTAFFFSTLMNFKPCLEILVQAVTESSFTEDMVGREKEVILQELAMYEDNPDYLADLTFMRMISGEEGDGFNILGTRDSLIGLSAEQIRSFHRTCYRPDRMTLVMIGDLDPDDVFQQLAAEERLTAAPVAEPIAPEEKRATETLPGKKSGVLNLNISHHLARMGWRIPFAGRQGPERIRRTAAVQVLVECLFGRASEFQVRLADEGRLLEPLNLRTELLDEEIIGILEATGLALDELSLQVLKVVQAAKENGLRDESVRAAKHKLFGEWVLMYDDMPTFLYEFSDMMIRDEPVHQFLQALHDVKPADVIEVLQDVREERFASLLVTGREKENHDENRVLAAAPTLA